jgi:hypothetical protein
VKNEDVRNRFRRDYTRETLETQNSSTRHRPVHESESIKGIAPKNAAPTMAPAPVHRLSFKEHRAEPSFPAPASEAVAEQPLPLPKLPAMPKLRFKFDPVLAAKFKRLRPPKPVLIALALVVVLIIGYFLHKPSSKSTGTSANQSAKAAAAAAKNSGVGSDTFNQKQKPLSSDVSKLSEAIYYPDPNHMPPGFTVNGDTQVVNDTSMFYSISDTATNNYSVIEQPLQPGFSLDVLAKNYKNIERFKAPIGDVMMGTTGAQLIANIQTPEGTWIMVNANELNMQPQLKAIINSLVPTKK